MKATNIEVVQNDQGGYLEFTLQDANGDAFDITGATLKFQFKEEGSSTTSSKSMTIQDGSNGVCRYTIQSGDFDNVGRYDAEIQVTNGSVITTYPHIQITVVPQIA